MDRLTEKDKYGIRIVCKNCSLRGRCFGENDCISVIAEKLFAYEDTGLTPEEIKSALRKEHK